MKHITSRRILVVLATTVLIVAVLLAGTFFAASYYSSSRIAPLERVDDVVYLNQGWGASREAEQRQAYYYTPQGAGLSDLRYSWFVHLEHPWGTARLADPDVLRRYGFIVDPPTPSNPDQLPVGFTRHFDPALKEDLLDLTCAACHTGQLQITRNNRTTAIRIDGGQAMHAFTATKPGQFVPTLVASLASTYLNPLKFNRLARHVLGEHASGRDWLHLHGELRKVLVALTREGWTEYSRHLYPTEEGNGRTDALARIANAVFGKNLDPANYAIGNAPVSYPPVWNIWKFDWVQYNASVSQPMARNIGEAMGVGAKYALVDPAGRPLPPDQRFRSSALVDNLQKIELALWNLRPPAWPEAEFGPIDWEKAGRGKALFDRHCVACHGPHVAPASTKAINAPLKSAAQPEWLVKVLCVDDIGTDPNAAMNFVRAKVDLTRTGLTADDLRRVARKPLIENRDRRARYLSKEALAALDQSIERTLAQIDPKRLSVGAALSYLGTMIREKAYGDLRYTPEQQLEHDGFGILDMPQIVAGYKPRPLAGVWATPPYLHNGSVPTIYDLLSPVEERPKEFAVGSREFDPRRLGLVARPGRFFIFKTSESGNHNTGHEFNRGYVEWTPGSPPAHGLIGPLLMPDERLAIIEHLKVRDDDRDGPKEPAEIEGASCPEF